MLDIRIKNTGNSLDLGNITINFQASSSLFTGKIAQDYYSYNFTIPSTNTNRKELNHPQIIETEDSWEEYPVYFYINGVNELEGTLKILEATEDYIKINVACTNFDTTFLDNPLNEMEFGDDIDIGPDTSDVYDHLMDTNDLSYPDTPYVFPMVYNENFYNGDNPGWWNVINNYKEVGSPVVVDNYEDSTGTFNRNTIIPYFFLIWILKQIFENNGVELRGSFITNEEAQQILVHNNYALDEYEDTFYYANVALGGNWDVTGAETLVCATESPAPYEDDDNIYNTSNGEITLNEAGVLEVTLGNVYALPDWHNNVISYHLRVRLKVNSVTRDEKVYQISGFNASDLLIELACNITTSDVSSGYKATVEFYFYRVYYYLGGYPEASHSGTVYNGLTQIINNGYKSELNIHKKTISPSNHMLNVSARDFVNNVISDFAILPYYDVNKRILYLDFFEALNNNKAYIDVSKYIKSYALTESKSKGYTIGYDISNDSFFEDQEADFSEYTRIGDITDLTYMPVASSVNLLTYVKSVNAYYATTIVDSDIEWVRVKEAAVEKAVVGDGSQNKTISFSPFSMDLIPINDYNGGSQRPYLLPQINEVGTSNLYGVGENECSYKLLLWHGMTNIGGSTGTYGFASSYNYDQNGNDVCDLSLTLNDNDNSFFKSFLYSLYNFIALTKLVKHKLTPNYPNLFNYPFNIKQLIVNQRFLTKTIKIKFSRKGAEDIEVENYKV